MGILDATKNYFLKWNDFKSRISRSEYWWGLLGIYIITIVFVFALVFVVSIDTTIYRIVFTVYYFFNFVAGISLVARRLHDVNRSGWWYLIIWTGIGMLVILYWLCKKGDEEENRFGSNPLVLKS